MYIECCRTRECSKFVCAGSIIRKDYILTAGHCGLAGDQTDKEEEAGKYYYAIL